MWPTKRHLQLTVVWREGWPMYDLYAVLDGVPQISLDPNDVPSIVWNALSDLAQSSSMSARPRTGGGSPS